MKVLLGVALTAAAMLNTSASPDKECENFYTAVSNSKKYTIYNNMWNHVVAGPNGRQCTYLTGQGVDFVSWNTSWSYSYDAKTRTDVKSYANAALTMNPVQISPKPLPKGITIKSRMVYTVQNPNNNAVANVAYDLFTSSTIGGKKKHEIMIWLAAIGGALPISSDGKIIATIGIGKHKWNYYQGMNGEMKVHSFVITKQETNFDGDLMPFIDYLNFPTTQYLFKLECGQEAYVGTDVSLKVSHYSAAIGVAIK